MAAADTKPEVTLALDLIAGKPGAFDEFVGYFRRSIFSYAQMICGSREDAEEVTQDTLMKVLESFDQIRDPEHVKAWVLRIARNGCLMKRRRSVFAPTQELSIDDFLPQAGQDGDSRRLEIADWSALPDDQVLQHELRQVVHDAIQRLPEIYRAVITLRDIEELSTAEAAEALDTTPEVVKTRLHRARLSVRQQLDEYLKTARAQGAKER